MGSGASKKKSKKTTSSRRPKQSNLEFQDQFGSMRPWSSTNNLNSFEPTILYAPPLSSSFNNLNSFTPSHFSSRGPLASSFTNLNTAPLSPLGLSLINFSPYRFDTGHRNSYSSKYDYLFDDCCIQERFECCAPRRLREVIYCEDIHF